MTCPLKPASRRLVSTTLPLLLRRDDAPTTAIVRGLISASIMFDISPRTLLAGFQPDLDPVGVLVTPAARGTRRQCPFRPGSACRRAARRATSRPARPASRSGHPLSPVVPPPWSEA